MARYLALALAMSISSQLESQARLSEFSQVTQVISAETLSVEYFRPRARGRRIFGGLVAWGAPWTPGANLATTISFSVATSLNGVALASGEYSLWFVPHPNDAWEILLGRAPRAYHLWPPVESDIVARTKSVPRKAREFKELLSWTVSHVARDAATFEFGWAGTVLSLQVILESRDLASRSYIRHGQWTGDSLAALGRKYSIAERQGSLVLSISQGGRIVGETRLRDVGGCQFRPIGHVTSSRDWMERGRLIELSPCQPELPADLLRIWSWEGELLAQASARRD